MQNSRLGLFVPHHYSIKCILLKTGSAEDTACFYPVANRTFEDSSTFVPACLPLQKPQPLIIYAIAVFPEV